MKMNRPLPLALAAACLVGLAGLWGGSGGHAAAADPASPALKGVVHVNFAGDARQKHGLRSVDRILKAEPGAELEVVCHGPGLELLVKGKSEAPDDVVRLAKEGVRFVACENSMKDKSVSREDLLPGVGTVPSGAAEVIHKQQEGYGYFRP